MSNSSIKGRTIASRRILQTREGLAASLSTFRSNYAMQLYIHMYSWRADTPAKKEKETLKGLDGVFTVLQRRIVVGGIGCSPRSRHLYVYVCVEQLLEWMHGVQSAAEVCCNKSNAGVKYPLKLWRVGGNGGG